MPKMTLIGYALGASGLMDVLLAVLILEPPAQFILIGAGVVSLLIGVALILRGRVGAAK